MKSFKNIFAILTFTYIPVDAKRPPKLPKEPKTPLSSEQRQAIAAGAAQAGPQDAPGDRGISVILLQICSTALSILLLKR